jgi:hypothetical protein
MRGDVLHLPLLLLAAFLWTAEGSGRAEESGESGSSVSRSPRSYQPVDRAPDVLCGCTEVLKTFA